jgi:hypothetical protein
MSMACCTKCDRIVDTDDDLDCYENPRQVCICENCRDDDAPKELAMPQELDALLEALAEKHSER